MPIRFLVKIVYQRLQYKNLFFSCSFLKALIFFIKLRNRVGCCLLENKKFKTSLYIPRLLIKRTVWVSTTEGSLYLWLLGLRQKSPIANTTFAITSIEKKRHALIKIYKPGPPINIAKNWAWNVFLYDSNHHYVEFLLKHTTGRTFLYPAVKTVLFNLLISRPLYIFFKQRVFSWIDKHSLQFQYLTTLDKTLMSYLIIGRFKANFYTFLLTFLKKITHIFSLTEKKHILKLFVILYFGNLKYGSNVLPAYKDNLINRILIENKFLMNTFAKTYKQILVYLFVDSVWAVRPLNIINSGQYISFFKSTFLINVNSILYINNKLCILIIGLLPHRTFILSKQPGSVSHSVPVFSQIFNLLYNKAAHANAPIVLSYRILTLTQFRNV